MTLLTTYLKGNKKNIFIVILLSIITSVLSYNISRNLRVIFIFHSEEEVIFQGILYVVCMYISTFIISILSTLFNNKSLYKSNRNLKMYSLDKLYKTDFKFLAENSPIKLSAEIGMISSKISLYYNSFIRSISVSIQFIVYFYIIFHVDAIAGLLVILFMPVMCILTLGVSKKMKDSQALFRDSNVAMFSFGLEAIQHSKNIKTKNVEHFFTEEFENKNEDLTRKILKYASLESYSDNILAFIVAIAPITILYYLVSNKYIEMIKQEEIIILYLFIPLLLNSFTRLYKCLLEFNSSKPYIHQFKKYKELDHEPTALIVLKKFKDLKTESLSLELESKRIITIPDMYIKSGSKVLIKGASGLGKSTFFNILLGLRSDYKGSIFINDINLKEYDIQSVRKIIGISFQEAKIYSMSLEENIKLDTPGCVIPLINMTELDKLYADKKNTTISTNTISGGEKSRISIAQNLVKSPEVLLLDETTVSLDEAMEERLLENLTKNESTVLCISHRKSTNKYFDKIVEFKEVVNEVL